MDYCDLKILDNILSMRIINLIIKLIGYLLASIQRSNSNLQLFNFDVEFENVPIELIFVFEIETTLYHNKAHELYTLQ